MISSPAAGSRPVVSVSRIETGSLGVEHRVTQLRKQQFVEFRRLPRLVEQIEIVEFWTALTVADRDAGHGARRLGHGQQEAKKRPLPRLLDHVHDLRSVALGNVPQRQQAVFPTNAQGVHLPFLKGLLRKQGTGPSQVELCDAPMPCQAEIHLAYGVLVFEPTG